MNLLLDTHALLWWVDGQSLSDTATSAIADPDNLVFVSAATVWEIGIKVSIGKLRVPAGLADAIAEDFSPLPIGVDHAWAAGALPLHHRDPFDRMLVAQASVDQLTIVTRDRHIPRYDVATLLA